MSPNLKAYLDVIAWSEIGPALLSVSDNGYNVCVGSTLEHPILFSSYATHPLRHDVATNSDAAGRYQFMGRYWPDYKKQLGLPDFGHDSQDKWAAQLIRECHALDDVEAGRFEDAVFKCRSRWASFPAAGYGQHENKLVDMKRVYEASGGKYVLPNVYPQVADVQPQPVTTAPMEPAHQPQNQGIVSLLLGIFTSFFGKTK